MQKPAAVTNRRHQELVAEMQKGNERWPALRAFMFLVEIPKEWELHHKRDCHWHALNFSDCAIMELGRIIAGNRAIVRANRVVYAESKDVRERLGIECGSIERWFFVDEAGSSGESLRAYDELATRAQRCIQDERGDDFYRANYDEKAVAGWTLGMAVTGLIINDPVLFSNSYDLKLNLDRDEIQLGPFTGPIPDGIAEGHRVSLPWRDAFRYLADCVTKVCILEPGLFYASAYYLERLRECGMMGVQTDPPGDEPPRNLTKTDWLVLQELGRSPHALTAIDLSGRFADLHAPEGAPTDRKAIGKALLRLQDLGLASRQSVQTGFTITSAGKTYLQQNLSEESAIGHE